MNLSAKPIRVLIADDSAFMRTALRRLLESDPGIQVVGEADDGLRAVMLVGQLDPDVVTLDLEMPRMDGLRALERIMRSHPRPVIMVSSLTSDGAEATLDALALGAFDYIAKPMSRVSLDIVNVRDDLVRKIKAAAGSPVRRRTEPNWGTRQPVSSSRRIPHNEPGDDMERKIVCIGTSTGGPAALQKILPQIPADFPVPIVVVQHMPVGFTEPFARRLNSLSKLEVHEAGRGELLKPGVALIAPAGQHLTFRINAYSGPSVHLSPDDKKHFHVPSVDVMMLSAAETFGSAAIGVILTGMGADGAQGMKQLFERGAMTIGQDERSCAVYGMPRACAEMEILRKVVSLDAVPSELANSVCARARA
jgi:two-component system chemotaxis response regulator CheB